jgi:hypothetical protein
MKKLVLALFASLIVAGCGGGGGGGGDTATPTAGNSTTYSTAKLFPLSSTEATSFTLTGSDNKGGTWTGSWLLRGDGQTVYEGKNVTKITQQVILKLTRSAGSATTSSYVASYYNADRSLYKAIYSGTASGYAVQTNDFIPPLSYKFGDVVTGPTLTTYINGVTDHQTSTLRIADGGNGNAKVTGTVVLTSGTTGSTEQIINPAGDLLSIKMVFYYPTGLTVTLNGSR